MDQARSLIRGGIIELSLPARSKSFHLLHESGRYAHRKCTCVVDEFSWDVDELTPESLTEFRFFRVINQAHRAVEIVRDRLCRGGDLSRCARRHGKYPSVEFKYTGFRLVY